MTEIEVGGKLGESDHEEVRFRLKWKVEADFNPAKVPNLRCCDFEGLRSDLNICWQALFERSGLGSGSPSGEGINQRAREGVVINTTHSNYRISLAGEEEGRSAQNSATQTPVEKNLRNGGL